MLPELVKLMYAQIPSLAQPVIVSASKPGKNVCTRIRALKPEMEYFVRTNVM